MVPVDDVGSPSAGSSRRSIWGSRQRALAIVSPTAAESRARNHSVAREQLHFEEVAQRRGGEDQGEERAEPDDQRQHVALDRDVLAAGAALQQQHEGEAEHDQGRRRRGAARLQGAAEDGVDEEEGEDRAERRRQPGRDREGGQRAQQAAAVERPVGGRQGEHEGGDADRQEGGQGQVAGQEGEGEAGHRDEQDQGRGVDGLGQVEAAEAVDVAGDPPALGDRLRAGARTRPRAGRRRRRPWSPGRPEPIATAIRACFSAGTSLTPSPIIAV